MNAPGNLFSFRSLVRSRTPVTESEIYIVAGLFLLMIIVQKPTAKSYFSKRRVISAPGFADVISRESYEVRHPPCVSNKSKCNVYAICRQTQLSTRWYANLLNINLNYIFRPQSLAIIRLYKRKLIN